MELSEPDLTLTFGSDVDILDGPAVTALIKCYDRKIEDHVIAYGLARTPHAHFIEHVAYYQARKRNLLVLWAEAAKEKRDSEPF